MISVNTSGIANLTNLITADYETAVEAEVSTSVSDIDSITDGPLDGISNAVSGSIGDEIAGEFGCPDVNASIDGLVDRVDGAIDEMSGTVGYIVRGVYNAVSDAADALTSSAADIDGGCNMPLPPIEKILTYSEKIAQGIMSFDDYLETPTAVTLRASFRISSPKASKEELDKLMRIAYNSTVEGYVDGTIVAEVAPTLPPSNTIVANDTTTATITPPRPSTSSDTTKADAYSELQDYYAAVASTVNAYADALRADPPNYDSILNIVTDKLKEDPNYDPGTDIYKAFDKIKIGSSGLEILRGFTTVYDSSNSLSPEGILATIGTTGILWYTANFMDEVIDTVSSRTPATDYNANIGTVMETITTTYPPETATIAIADHTASTIVNASPGDTVTTGAIAAVGSIVSPTEGFNGTPSDVVDGNTATLTDPSGVIIGSGTPLTSIIPPPPSEPQTETIWVSDLGRITIPIGLDPDELMWEINRQRHLN